MNWFMELALYWKILIGLMFVPWINLWVLMLALKLLWIPTGWVAVPFLWRYRNTDYADLPKLAHLWANLEDWRGQPNHHKGCLPRWWVKEHGTGFWSFYSYHAGRNGADGIRSVKLLDLNLYDGNIKFKTPFYMPRYEAADLRMRNKRAGGYFCWQGWQAGMKWLVIWNSTHHASIKLGWRIEPRHATSVTNVVEQRLLDLDPSRRQLLVHRDFSASPKPYRNG